MSNFTPYKLPELSYDFSDLEPIISEEIMQLHYSKHHGGYVTNLNVALEKMYEMQQKGDIAAVTAGLQAIKFNEAGMSIIPYFGQIWHLLIRVEGNFLKALFYMNFKKNLALLISV